LLDEPKKDIKGISNIGKEINVKKYFLIVHHSSDEMHRVI
jgi:hypothetical protein